MLTQIKILLVEDEIINAMLVTKILDSIGCSVAQHVTTGENAIASVKQNLPDVILMDIRLAGTIDGIDAALIIKSEFDIPIIFITGYDDQSIKDRAYKLNPIGYLIKPLDSNLLKKILQDFFA